MEQNSIGYIFPDEIHKISPDHVQSNGQTIDSPNTKSKSSEHDWQFVIPVPTSMAEESNDNGITELEMKEDFVSLNNDQESMIASGSISNEMVSASGIFPAARARLASLRDLGAKKIGALKLKLIENKIKSNERGEYDAIRFCIQIHIL